MSTSGSTNNWTLYKHTSPSGKVYIGITGRPLTERWGTNGCKYKGSHAFYNAILKYGWDNIKHESLISNLSKAEAVLLEMKFIKYYKDLNLSYNITDGGEGTKGVHPSPETTAKRLASTAKTGYVSQIKALNRNRAIIGVKHRKAVVQLSMDGDYVNTYHSIKEASENMKIDATMISHCCKKRLYSAGNYLWLYKTDFDALASTETLSTVIEEIVAKAKYKNGSYERTKEWRTNKSNQLRGKDRRSSATKALMQQRSAEARRKPVLQLSLDGIPIRVFNSTRDVERTLKYSRGYIGNCCNGKKAKAYGYKWRYLSSEEYDNYRQNKIV